MEEKIREQIRNIEGNIKLKQKYLDTAVECFKKSAISYDAYHIKTHLPGKIEEIAKYMADMENLEWYKLMLEYMLGE